MRTFAPLPYRRADWLAARAAHAGRRNVRLAAVTLAAFLVVFGGLLVSGDAWRPLVSALRNARRLADLPRAPGIDRASIFGMLVAALILGLLLAYALNLAHEIARPRLAGVREAEQVVGAPVVAVVETAGRSRTPGERVNPYRLAYLSLSPAESHAPTIVLTGDDGWLVAAIAAGIARMAASDARATVVLDLDVERAPASSHYEIQSEPGFTDAMVGVRLWREVALPVGANDGLSIDVVPGGAPRREVQEYVATPAFDEFKQEHDFCVVIAPGASAYRRACALFRSPLTLLCAQQETTTLRALNTWRVRLAASAAKVHGLVLWNAPTPGKQRIIKDSHGTS